MTERIAKVLAAVAAGKISEREADAYLRATVGCTYAEAKRGHAVPAESALSPASTAAPAAPAASHRKEHAILTLLLIVPVLLILGLAMMDGSLTGMVVLDILQENATNSTIPINESFTGVNVSGFLYGDGAAAVYLDTPNGTFLVANISSDAGLPRTAKASYALGEIVLLEHAPASATYYFDDGTTSLPTSVPFNASTNGTLLIVANESGSLTTYRLPVIIGSALRQTVFENACIETCALDATNGTLRIQTSGNATLELTRVDIAAIAPNRAPQLAIAIPAQTVNASTSIDLDLYFVDPDGDTLIYDAGSSDLVNTSINGTTLTMTPLQKGNGTLTIYASDLQELVQVSIELAVTAIENEPVTLNETLAANTTVNITNGTNTTVEINSTEANASAENATALDCSDPNPNLRPVDCITMDSAKLLEEDIFWESMDRARVGRFTQIGNLLIAGRAFKEDAVGVPGSRDFTIGYTDDEFNRVATMWVDVEGNLHLRGRIYEMNANLNPPPGSHVMINRRGVYLAYADPATGDLYLRGNLIPYRDDVQG